MLPAKFGSIWPSCFRGEDFFNQAVSEEKIFLTLANQKTELILMAMFVG
jgi:hypothetical protein